MIGQQMSIEHPRLLCVQDSDKNKDPAHAKFSTNGSSWFLPMVLN